jgi:hypothetical protein
MGMRVDKETERRILQLVADGLPLLKRIPDEEPQEMVEFGIAIEKNRLTCTIPCITRSEANESKWHKKMARKLSVKRAVRESLGRHHAAFSTFAEHFHQGKPLRVVLTRLGGRKLDALANLGASLKGVEDMIAGLLLADDGSPLWQATAAQEPGGPMGVRVEITI